MKHRLIWLLLSLSCAGCYTQTLFVNEGWDGEPWNPYHELGKRTPEMIILGLNNPLAPNVEIRVREAKQTGGVSRVVDDRVRMSIRSATYVMLIPKDDPSSSELSVILEVWYSATSIRMPRFNTVSYTYQGTKTEMEAEILNTDWHPCYSKCSWTQFVHVVLPQSSWDLLESEPLTLRIKSRSEQLKLPTWHEAIAEMLHAAEGIVAELEPPASSNRSAEEGVANK